MANGIGQYNPYASFMGLPTFTGSQSRFGIGANPPTTQNWLTDPEAPWNVWAQDLEGYLQQWVKSQQQGLLADLATRTGESAQQAIGQGLYTGTYTTSLPAENLAKMVAQHQRGYAGAMSGLQSQALAQLMSGQQQYGRDILSATLAEMQMKAQAEAQSGGFLDFLSPILQGGTMVAGKFLMGCFAEDTPIQTERGNIPISDIKIGDRVLGEDVSKKVVKVFAYDDSPTLLVNDIEVTKFHPFVMADGTLRFSGNLSVGDKLYGGVEVKNISEISSPKKVYNLEVDGHRYWVGNMLVHDGRELRV